MIASVHDEVTTAVAPRAALLPLLRDLNELKRVRPAPSGRSLAERSFLRAWGSIAAGADPALVARRELHRALVSTRLAGADVTLLVEGGLAVDDATAVCAAARQQALDRAGPWAEVLGDVLTDVAGAESERHEANRPPPTFAALLAAQPRAPATRADLPRVSVEPPENHAEHCAAVAVAGVVMAGVEGADPGRVFLAGLAHHLHNARLPDGGFAGEEALGPFLTTVTARFCADALAELPAEVAEAVAVALASTVDESTPEGRAFHAADVVDRVLQTHHHARLAAFTVEQAVEEYGLVHEGPLQRYHQLVLAEVGL